jgi:DMSO/TMAO reductase YedYZ molybdopterin-dependent catalytic subunit
MGAMVHLPEPLSRLRRGPLRAGAFHANLHEERTTSLVGTALGIAFAVAFVTGIISHELQHPPSWLPLPTRPVWFYRFTQGLHVASGLAAIPLLLAKLWTVYPRLFAWPPITSVINALERLSIGVLVAGAVFELVTGLLDTAQWYAWHFPFIQTHFWVAWITVGALLLHLAVKAPAIARGLRPRRAGQPGEPGADTETQPDPDAPRPSDSEVGVSCDAASAPGRPGAVSRRVLIASTGLAVGAVTLTTVGQSVTPLRSLALLAPRDPTFGPQHVPINRTARQAGVLADATDPAWRLTVAGPRSFTLTLDELAALPQYDSELPISCVEGWSVNAHWRGVRIRDLLARAGAPPGASLRVVSLEQHGAYGVTTMQSEYAHDPLTLLALSLGGAPLSIDHGYPARVIAPARPGVLQTKWLSRLEVV